MWWYRMVTDAPTGSITGDDDWEWNKWQGDAATRSQDTSTRDPPVTHRRPSREAPDYRALAIDLHEANRRLEEELDKKDQRLHYITAHYEGLLQERNHELRKRTADADRDCLADRLAALFGYLTPL